MKNLENKNILNVEKNNKKQKNKEKTTGKSKGDKK